MQRIHFSCFIQVGALESPRYESSEIITTLLLTHHLAKENHNLVDLEGGTAFYWRIHGVYSYNI